MLPLFNLRCLKNLKKKGCRCCLCSSGKQDNTNKMHSSVCNLSSIFFSQGDNIDYNKLLSMLSYWSGCNTLNTDNFAAKNCVRPVHHVCQFFSFILGQLSLTAFCIPLLLNLREGKQSCINIIEKKN